MPPLCVGVRHAAGVAGTTRTCLLRHATATSSFATLSSSPAYCGQQQFQQCRYYIQLRPAKSNLSHIAQTATYIAFRHASTTPSKKSPTSTATSSTTSHNSSPSAMTSIASGDSPINPPRSTLPPALELPERQPEQSTPSYLFSQGKAYLRFYKDGLKAVFTNVKAAALLRRDKLSDSKTSRLTPLEAASQNFITRGEYHLLRRSAADMRRIPMFALLFAICGEFTPFVVVFASPLVPWTCRIPIQVRSDRSKRQERRQLSFHDTGEQRLREAGAKANWDVDQLGREELLHVGRCFDLYAKTWDRLGGFPRVLLRSRIRKYVEYLRVDDDLIRRAGGSAQLNAEEIIVACEDRGLDVLNKAGEVRSEADMGRDLQRWLKTVQEKSVLELVLVR